MREFYDNYGNFFLRGAPKKNSIHKNTDKRKKCVLKTFYTKKFLLKKLTQQKRSRCVCVTGHLHHGKSAFINTLSTSVYLANESFLFDDFSNFFYMEKQVSMAYQLSVFTLLLCSTTGKTYLLTLIDCPGHFEFSEQALLGVKLSDGILLIIDISEGISTGTEFHLRNSVVENLPIIVILNSIDRMILEYGFSTSDVQKRLINVLDDLNSILEESVFKKKCTKKNIFFFNPVENNVCFASFLQGWSFTLRQYAELYISCQPSLPMSTQDLSSKFWNNFYYKKKFLKNNPNPKKKTMFVEFILEPLYKLSIVSSSEPILHVEKFVQNELGLFGKKKSEFIRNFTNSFNSFVVFFGGCRKSKLAPNHTGIILSIITHIPRFQKIQKFKKNFVKKKYLFKLLGYIYKSHSIPNEKYLLNLVRVIKGLVFKKINFLVMTEGHEFYVNEFFYLNCAIRNIFLPLGHYNLELSLIRGSLVILIKSTNEKIRKTGILFKTNFKIKYTRLFFISLSRTMQSKRSLCNFLSIATEPIYPYQLHRFQNCLRKISNFYFGIECERNRSGNFFLYGTGELYLDCVVHDIKSVYEKLNVRISNPFFITRRTVSFEKKYIKAKLTNKIEIKISKNHNTYHQINLWNKNENFPLLNTHTVSKYWKNFKKSINSGFFINKIEKKHNTDKIRSNSIWAKGPVPFSRSFCLLNNCSVKKKYNFDKNTIIRYIDSSVSECYSLFFSLYGLEFELHLPKRSLEFSRKDLYGLFPMDRTFVTRPYFLSQIASEPRFFSVITRNIKLNEGQMFSCNFFSTKQTFVIKFTIPWKKSIGLQAIFSFLVWENFNFSFLYEGWKKYQ